MKVWFIIICITTTLITTSCRVQEIPPNLVGKWEKVQFGKVDVDNRELLMNVENDKCPNGYYLFSKKGQHILTSYGFNNGECVEYPEERKFNIKGDTIYVEGGKYIYTIKELKKEYLKLYLHIHEFTNTNSSDKNTTFIYTFLKSKE